MTPENKDKLIKVHAKISEREANEILIDIIGTRCEQMDDLYSLIAKIYYDNNDWNKLLDKIIKSNEVK